MSDDVSNERKNQRSAQSARGIEQIVAKVESEVLAEDKMGATREMMVEGTCARIRSRLSERFQPCEECGHPVDTIKPGVGKATNDEQWWHPGCFDAE